MKKRMTIELSEKMDKEITNIMKSNDNSSKVEVIRNALALYVYAMKEAQDGNNLAITKNSNVVKEIVMAQ